MLRRNSTINEYTFQAVLVFMAVAGVACITAALMA